MTETADGVNAGQIDYWNSEVGDKWVRHEAVLDQAFAIVVERLLDFVDPAPGARVLDIGCGGGATSLAFAERVGPSGRVLGVDVSAALLERAEARRRALGLDQLAFEQADAQTRDFSADGFDAAISRFGVMFFEDPVAAFANIARGLRPGGGIAFAAWAGIADNPWFRLSRDAATAVLGPPEPMPPRAPGPLAFAEVDYVTGMLRDAGLQQVEAIDVPLTLPFKGALDEVATFAVQFGPAARRLKALGAGEDVVAEISRRIAQAFLPFAGDDVVAVPAHFNFYFAKARG